jgi:hypothetical protein
MKKLLMTVAAVLAFVGVAHADPLPREMLGRWCADGYTDGRMWRVINRLKQDCDEWTVIRARGLTDIEGERTCRFTSIRKVGKSFAITARCRAEESPPYTAKMELSASGDFLTFKEEDRP